MKKKLVEKRIETFKSLYPDHKVSERGFTYAIAEDTPISHKKVVMMCLRNLSKNQLHKIGEKREFNVSLNTVVGITDKGKVLYKGRQEKRFKQLDKRVFKEDYVRILRVNAIGRKYEWINSQPDGVLLLLHDYKNFALGFSSLKELKNFMGYTSIPVSRFSQLLAVARHIHFNSLEYLMEVTNKGDVTKFLKWWGDIDNGYLLRDSIDMAKQLGLGVKLPTSLDDLDRWHKELTYQSNSIKWGDDWDKDRCVWSGLEAFEKGLCDAGFIFEQLRTPKQMVELGRVNDHCLSSHVYGMGYNLYYSFSLGEETYQAQIASRDGTLVQFRGKFNKPAPEEAHGRLKEVCKILTESKVTISLRSDLTDELC